MKFLEGLWYVTNKNWLHFVSDPGHMTLQLGLQRPWQSLHYLKFWMLLIYISFATAAVAMFYYWIFIVICFIKIE